MHCTVRASSGGRGGVLLKANEGCHVMIMRDSTNSDWGWGLEKKWESAAAKNRFSVPNGFRRKIRNQDARARVCGVMIFDISTMT
jgi:hypothetical protein